VTRKPPEADQPEIVEWTGKYMAAKRRGTWEYAARTRSIGAAVILALDGGDVILIEQWRMALMRGCIELPAGLVGDEAGHEGDTPFAAAERELIEETGYSAANWEEHGQFVTSPGITDESFTLFRASGLTRVGPGGGTADEEIAVHRVPVSQIGAFIAEARARGCAIDVKLLALLGGGFLEDAAQ
jgi:ADP-ribose pyrophosphatase